MKSAPKNRASKKSAAANRSRANAAKNSRANSAVTPPISLKELARRLNLSPTTLSLVLNRSAAADAIPAATKERIFAAAEGFNYRPNLMARSLRSQRTFSVGVLVPEFSDGYSAMVLSGIEEILLREGYIYLVTSHRHKSALIDRHPKLLYERRVEGLIAVDTPYDQNLPLPVVSVSGHKNVPGVTNIVLNHRTAAEAALRHLVGLGHRHIAFLRGQDFSSDTEVRWEAIRAAARKLSIRIAPENVAQLEGESPTPEVGYIAAKKLVTSREPFTALFAFNDISAFGAVRAFHEAGWRVPAGRFRRRLRRRERRRVSQSRAHHHSPTALAHGRARGGNAARTHRRRLFAPRLRHRAGGSRTGRSRIHRPSPRLRAPQAPRLMPAHESDSPRAPRSPRPTDQPRTSASPRAAAARRGPESLRNSQAAAHLGFVLTGVVNTLLGPILPIVSRSWSLSDAQAGRLFAAQFLGAILGTLASGRLMAALGIRRCAMLGLALMAVGVTATGFSDARLGALAVICFGLGLGVGVPATNLWIALAHPARSAAALNLLNASWCIGAASCAPLVLFFAERVGLTRTLSAIGILLALTAIFGSIGAGRGLMGNPPPAPPASSTAASAPPASSAALQSASLEDPAPPVPSTPSPEPLSTAPVAHVPRLEAGAQLFFIVLISVFLFFYVGVESGVGGWAATYAGRLNILAAAKIGFAQSVFYGALLVGRLLAPLALRRFTPLRLLTGGMLVGAAGTLRSSSRRARRWCWPGFALPASGWRRCSRWSSRSIPTNSAPPPRAAPASYLPSPIWAALLSPGSSAKFPRA